MRDNPLVTGPPNISFLRHASAHSPQGYSLRGVAFFRCFTVLLVLFALYLVVCLINRARGRCTLPRRIRPRLVQPFLARRHGPCRILRVCRTYSQPLVWLLIFPMKYCCRRLSQRHRINVAKIEGAAAYSSLMHRLSLRSSIHPQSALTSPRLSSHLSQNPALFSHNLVAPHTTKCGIICGISHARISENHAKLKGSPHPMTSPL